MKITVITNRLLLSSEENFLNQMEKIAKGGADTIILREKNISEEEYTKIAKKISLICHKYPNTALTANKYINAAKNCEIRKIQLSFTDFIKYSKLKMLQNDFDSTGVSIHSPTEAVEAEKNGADYIIAGHIFETDCKKGVPHRGINFLKNICDSVKIPVYAIGGITPKNIAEIKKTSAKGVCIMSSAMLVRYPEILIQNLKNK